MEAKTEVEATSILPSLNGKTARSWRGFLGTLVGWTIVTLWNAGIRPVGHLPALSAKSADKKI